MLLSRMLSLLLISSSFVSSACGQISAAAQRVTIVEKGEAIALLLQIAETYHVPLGIVFDDERSLCHEQAGLVIRDQSVETALQALASQRAYLLEKNKYGFVLVPRQLSKHLDDVLTYRIHWFPSAHETLPTAAARLSGFILIGTEGASGFASDVLGDPSTPKLDIPELRQVSFQEVAGKLASLGAGSIWLLSRERSIKEGAIGSARFSLLPLTDLSSEELCSQK